MIIQYIISGMIICIAVIYAIFRVYKAFKAAYGPCSGCSGCAMREQMGRRKNRFNTFFHLPAMVHCRAEKQ